MYSGFRCIYGVYLRAKPAEPPAAVGRQALGPLAARQAARPIRPPARNLAARKPEPEPKIERSPDWVMAVRVQLLGCSQAPRASSH